MRPPPILVKVALFLLAFSVSNLDACSVTYPLVTNHTIGEDLEISPEVVGVNCMEESRVRTTLMYGDQEQVTSSLTYPFVIYGEPLTAGRYNIQLSEESYGSFESLTPMIIINVFDQTVAPTSAPTLARTASPTVVEHTAPTAAPTAVPTASPTPAPKVCFDACDLFNATFGLEPVNYLEPGILGPELTCSNETTDSLEWHKCDYHYSDISYETTTLFVNLYGEGSYRCSFNDEPEMYLSKDEFEVHVSILALFWDTYFNVTLPDAPTLNLGVEIPAQPTTCEPGTTASPTGGPTSAPTGGTTASPTGGPTPAPTTSPTSIPVVCFDWCDLYNVTFGFAPVNYTDSSPTGGPYPEITCTNTTGNVAFQASCNYHHQPSYQHVVPFILLEWYFSGDYSGFECQFNNGEYKVLDQQEFLHHQSLLFAFWDTYFNLTFPNAPTLNLGVEIPDIPAECRDPTQPSCTKLCSPGRNMHHALCRPDTTP